MAPNWFRNEAWNPAIAAAFDVRLRRARDKSQYLAIQAYCLRTTHPTVALELTDRCLEITKSLAHSMDATRAYEVRAVAHLALGNIEAAFANFDIVLGSVPIIRRAIFSRPRVRQRKDNCVQFFRTA